MSQFEQESAKLPDRLVPIVYDELRRLAASKLAQESPGQTLQATALVHEAFVKLSKSERKFNSHEHFFACVAEAMRQILVDSARRKKTAKHGGQLQRQPMVDDLIKAPFPPDELLQIHDALGVLSDKDSDLATVVKLRCFGGMKLAEIAEAMNLTRRQVDGKWAYARAILHRELGEDGS